MQWVTKMMKKMLGTLATVLFLIGLVGIAQAAGHDNGIDFCLEGPAYIHDGKVMKIVQTKLRPVQEGSLYIEGMGTSNRDNEIKTIIPIADNRLDFSTEGFSGVELELMDILKIHDEFAPAAGNISILSELMAPRFDALTFFE